MKKLFWWILTLLWALLIWRLTTTTQIVVTENSWLQNILMDFAHFSFFGIQAILLGLAINKSSILNPNLLPVAITSLYGALIEFRQLSVVGRTADPFDWMLDTLGAIAFLAIINAYYKKLSRKS